MSEMAKKCRTTPHPVVDFWRREVGGLSSRKFSNRFSASVNLVRRFETYTKLQRNGGVVESVSFNTEGNVLISASDDLCVTLWDWERGKMKLTFSTGHSNYAFQAKFMPFSNDATIITCAAYGEVRVASIRESGEVETSLLGMHQGQARQLAIEPGNPHVFYTCGQDRLVQRFDLRTQSPTKLCTCQPVHLWSSYRANFQLCAIAIDPRNSHLVAVGGIDAFARLYDIRKFESDGSNSFSRAADHFCPPHLIENNNKAAITGLAFSEQSELLVSYSRESIYLFKPDMGLRHNPISYSKSDDSVVPLVYKGHNNFNSVKGVNFFGPRSEYVVSGSDYGSIFIWRKKDGEFIRVTESVMYYINSVEPHPHIHVLASIGVTDDIKIWIPKKIERATLIYHHCKHCTGLKCS